MPRGDTTDAQGRYRRGQRGRLWPVSNGPTSTATRTLTIDGRLVATLRRWRAVQGELMVRAGMSPRNILTNATLERWHPTALGADWRKDAQRAADRGTVSAPIRLHDGHQTPAFTLAVYGHSDQQRDEAAAAAFGGVLGG